MKLPRWAREEPSWPLHQNRWPGVHQGTCSHLTSCFMHYTVESLLLETLPRETYCGARVMSKIASLVLLVQAQHLILGCRIFNIDTAVVHHQCLSKSFHSYHALSQSLNQKRAIEESIPFDHAHLLNLFRLRLETPPNVCILQNFYLPIPRSSSPETNSEDT
jgi:hypothetical protein